MNHVGDWVVIQVEENESAHGIISTNENSGVVVDSPAPELIGKKVFYSIEKAKENPRVSICPLFGNLWGDGMILFGDEVKEKLLQGINLVANTVRPTLGPQARTAILQGNPPVVINDGVTIAKQVSHEDPYVQMGVQLVQNLAFKAQSKAGDGTTTACVLAQALCNYLKAIDISNVHEFREELERTREAMLEALDELAVPVEGGDKILEVATIAANNDPALGELIASVFHFVGKDGVISVEEGHGLTTEYELRQGLELENGYISHLFANQDSGECILEKPLVLATNKAILNFADLLPSLEYASSQADLCLSFVQTYKALHFPMF